MFGLKNTEKKLQMKKCKNGEKNKRKQHQKAKKIPCLVNLRHKVVVMVGAVGIIIFISDHYAN